MALVTISDQELTINALRQMKETADGNYKMLPISQAYKEVNGEGKPSEDGGTVLIEGIQFGDHSQVSEQTTGYEPINLSVADVVFPAQYKWYMGIMPVVLSNFELLKNGGRAKVIDIVKALTDNVLGAFMRNFEVQLSKGAQAGFTQLGHFNGVDYTTGALEENAYASQSNTVGNLSKSTYNVYPGWANQAEDAAGSFNSGGFVALDGFQVRATNRDPSGGPSRYFGSESFMINAFRALRANLQYVSWGTTTEGMPKKLLWGGAPIVSSMHLPNAGTVTTANPISAYGINMKAMPLTWHGEGYFKAGEFEKRSGYDVKVLPIRVMVQLTPKHLGGSGVIMNADQW